MNEVKDSLEIILALVAIAGLIYKISQVERAIYDAIDAVKDANYEALHAVRDAANTRLHQLEAKLEVYLQKASDRREYEDYMFNDLKKAIDHKFDRLHTNQRDIQKYLQENFTFRARNYFGDRDEEDKPRGNK